MGSITVVSGASRCGKSRVVNKLIKANDSVVVYDSKCDVKDYQKIEFTYDFSLFINELKKPRSRIRFLDRKQVFFDLFCRSVSTVLFAKKEKLTVIVEELANLVSHGKATGSWGTLIRTGMSDGMNLIGVTQSPSESDKTILSNSTGFITFRSPRLDDRKYISNYINVSPDEINALNKYEYFDTTGGGSAVKIIQKSTKK